MATEERQADSSVIDDRTDPGPPSEAALSEVVSQVIALAPRTRFFTLVSLLERLMPDAERVGGDGPPSAESLRFRHDSSLSFHAGDVRAARLRKIPLDPESPVGPQRDGVEVISTFLGLTGAVSPLPLYMAEEVALEDAESPIKRDFLDLFHHRTLSLLYRLVARYSIGREHLSSTDDPWTRRFLALSGMDAHAGPPTHHLPRHVLLKILPLLSSRTRTARGLELALREALADAIDPDTTLFVRQFVGNRVYLDAQQRTQLGVKNHALGKSAVIGTKTIDRAGRFAVRVGPLGTRNYAGFMREGKEMQLVREVVRMFCRQPLDFDLELLLSADAVPRFRLSAEYPVPLGGSTWLRAKPMAQVHVIKDAHLEERRRSRAA